MIRLTQADLTDLATVTATPCVSMFVPVEPGDPRKWRTMLTNLIRRCEAQLAEASLPQDQRDRLLGPARTLAARDGTPNAAGMALFLTRDEGRELLLDCPVAPELVVAERFHLKPALAIRQRHWVLTLSQQRVRAFVGNRWQLTERHLAGLPVRGLDDVPGGGDHNELQAHSMAVASGGQTRFHGHRDDKGPDAEAVARLCRAAGDALHRELADPRQPSNALTSVPIVLACVGRLAAAFRRAVDWAHVVGVVEGNHDETPADALHALTWSRVESHRIATMEANAERLSQAIHAGRGSRDIREVALAAYDGRVSMLLLDPERTFWGVLRPSARRVELHRDAHDGDEDLLDRAVVCTLAHGGRVIPALPADLASESGVAALFRYE